MGVTICQVADPQTAEQLPCGHVDSDGLRCERTSSHDVHGVSRHTVHHELAGNGYTCESIEESVSGAVDLDTLERLGRLIQSATEALAAAGRQFQASALALSRALDENLRDRQIRKDRHKGH
jgi:hypothetical protein